MVGMDGSGQAVRNGRSVRSRIVFWAVIPLSAVLLLVASQRWLSSAPSLDADGQPVHDDLPAGDPAVREVTVSFQDGVDGYDGTIDTIMKQGAPTSTFGDLEMIGWDSSAEEAGDLWNSAFIRFDRIIGDGPGQIPPGATITEATVELTVFDPGEDAAIHPAEMPWDETTSHEQYGGMIGPPLDSLQGTVGVASLDVTSWASLWTSGTPNHGFMIMASGPDAVHARSSEYSDIAARPRLQVSFIPPGEENGGEDPTSERPANRPEPSPTTTLPPDE